MSGGPDPAAARWGGSEDAPAGADPRQRRGAPAGEPDPEPSPGSPVDEGADAGPGRGSGPRGRGAGTQAGARPSAGGAAAASTAGVAGTQGDRPQAMAGGTNGAGAILTDVAALTAERDDYLQSLQRLKADFDNYRKRVARLQEEQAARAEAGLVQKLLPVLDNLDLALAHLVQDEPATEDARALAQARSQLLDVLAKEGLERVDATGVAFDPTVHDAVAHAPADAEEDAGSEAALTAEPAGTTGAGAGERRGAPGGADAAVPDGGGGGGDGRAAPGDGSTAGVGSTGGGGAAAPGRHEVVVDGVLRAGYRWRGQVLRPAMVRVRG